ncbi:MAG: SOS response-associated peptidase [Acidimicrobiales bacterium]|nr:SOS response-associated peptidase [Acidimicrobiales bacterium]
MCGRYVSSSPPDEIARYFGVEALGEKLLEANNGTEEGLAPRYNVAPSAQVPVVRVKEARRELDLLHWGLVPFWAKDLRIGNKMINARSETVAEKNAFKRPLKRRRCIVPVDGFYEWETLTTPEQGGGGAGVGKKSSKPKKQPWYITRVDGDVFAIAGLWETWRGPDRDDSEHVESCTMLTGPPNDKMATIHHRMPVVLPPDAWERWLDPDYQDVDELQRLFVAAPSELITMHRVSPEVNNARNRGPQLIEPYEPDEGTLFSAAP